MRAMELRTCCSHVAGGLLAPERIGEFGGRDALAPPHDEGGEDHPFARAERVGARVERAEHQQRHAITAASGEG